MKRAWKPIVLVAVPLVLFLLGGLLALTFSSAVQADAGEQPAEAMATVSIAHFAPFASEVVSTSVTVRVAGTEVVTDFVFGNRINGVMLPPGTYPVEVLPTGSITPALATTVTLAVDDNVLLAAIGGPNGWPLEIYQLPIDPTPFTATGKLRITHLSPFSTTLAGTAVDICTQDGTPVPQLTNIQYKDTTDYLPLNSGIYDFKIAVAGTSCSVVALDLLPFALGAGQVADAFAIGLPGAPDVPLQVSQTGLAARVAFGHFAPFSTTMTGTAVSIIVDDSEVISNFVFPMLAPYQEITPGMHAVQIIPTGSVTPAISTTVAVSGFVDFTTAAIGGANGWPLELFGAVDDNATPPTPGKARLRLTHLAPFAALPAATKIDLCNADKIPLAQNVEYKQGATLELSAGIQSVYIAAPGTNCLLKVVDVPPFIVWNGQIAYAYAVGADAGSASIVTLPDLSIRWTFLPVIENP